MHSTHKSTETVTIFNMPGRHKQKCDHFI